MNGRGLKAQMYGWCSSLVHGVDSTKSYPVFINKPDSSFSPSLHPSIPPSRLSLHLHQPPFSPAIQLLLSPGQQAIQKAVAEQRQAVSCQLSERERERGRERPSSLSTKRYCLATNHGHPHHRHPQHSPSLCRKNRLAMKSTQWEGNYSWLLWGVCSCGDYGHLVG